MAAKSITFLRIPILFALVIVGSAHAQDWWPEVRNAEIPDECAAMDGISVAAYTNLATKSQVFHKSSICLDIENGRFSGPESAKELQLVKDFGGRGGMMQVIKDGDQPSQRRTLMVTPVINLMDPELLASKEPGVIASQQPIDLYSWHFLMPGEDTQLYPGTNLFSSIGFAFRNPRDDIDSLPEGRWIASIAASLGNGANRSGPVKVNSLLSESTSLKFETEADTVKNVAVGRGFKDASLSISAANGRITGSLGYSLENQLLEAARSSDDWASAELQIPEFEGRFVDVGGGLKFVALGVGRTVLTGSRGQRHEIPAVISVSASLIPPEITDEMAMTMGISMFGAPSN